MAANRWLISLGLVILIAMLVIAAFALGVYVGEHGWTRQGLQYQPGSAKPPDVRPPLPPEHITPPSIRPPLGGLPLGRPQILGRIRRINPKSLELATRDGPRVIILLTRTRYTDESGVSLTLRDFQLGDFIGVFGRIIQEDNSQQFLAEEIVKLPPPSP